MQKISWAAIPPDIIPAATAMASTAIFLSLWLLLWLPFAVPLALKLKWRPFQPSPPAQKLPLLLILYALAPLALWLYFLASGHSISFTDSLAASEMPLQPELFVSAGWGLLIGAGSLLALFLCQIKADWLQQDHTPNHTSDALKLRAIALPLLALLGLALWVGWTEELIFRGLIQNLLQQGIPPLPNCCTEASVHPNAYGDTTHWQSLSIENTTRLIHPSTIFTSLLFAGLHAIWEGKAVLPQLPGLWLMGMVLTLARQVDGDSLGLAWGLHAGWVWVIACLDALRLTQYTGKAPVWLTGLAGQPLAGLIGLGFLIATGGLLLCF
jgi:uncharacterized protein